MERDEDAYWRRRVIILAAGLVVMGVLAWALSSSGGGKPSAASRQVAVAQVRAANELPSAAYGSVPATPTASPSPSRSASPSPSPSKDAKRARRPREVLVRAASGCRAGSVVMTLFSQRPSYATGERPVFAVYAVSTSATDCAFRFGPGAVRVEVSHDGRLVWNSAYCHPAPVERVHLTRGGPAQMAVTWNRHAGYGCRGWLSANSTGRFTAIATTGTQTTPTAYFELVK
jgi:hypothetical protein